MAASFTLAINPWVYQAQYQDDGSWNETFVEKDHRSPEEEAAMPEAEHTALVQKRNSFPELPLVNYTTQYGMGCFEGLKAFPQPDGRLKLFRPDENAKRMHRSMEGLMMPAYPPEIFVPAVQEMVRRNYKLGFFPEYDHAWEKDGFVSARSVYIRPFSYAEPGIGLNLSSKPWVVMVSTAVGSYFDPEADAKAVTTDKVRATKGGTGWIKCDANYVIPTLTKKTMQKHGYMEVIFLDAATQTYVEEGSSCNIFFFMEDGTLVTPSLEDTVLAGINRMSAMQLAEDEGVKVEERRVPIEEVMDRAAECFVTGTAAGVSYIESVEHKGKTRVFRDGKMGELTRNLQWKLRGIQYGVVEDSHGWMYQV
ncbi:MAG: branched chain amino acid aminotransferase [Spirochaetes bacterium]|nr:branched chain amino acid aminotransferase [Spirochaetota bacterium]